MDLFQAAILGVLEGITEFLPISSTGHLILASHLLNIPQTEFLSSFEIAIQLGAILAAVVLYAKTLLRSWPTVLRVVVAFLPTAFIGLLLHDVVKQYLLGNDTVVVWALLLGGIALIVFERFHKESAAAKSDMATLPFWIALLIGCGQSLAILPGISRAAATIVTGLLLGMRRSTIVEFSFLLAIPTMAAATGLDLLKSQAGFTSQEMLALAVGFITAFLVALVSIRWLLTYIKHHSFTPFGVYRIVIAALYALLILR